MNTKSSHETNVQSISKAALIRDAIAEALENLDFVNAACWLYGIPWETLPVHLELWDKLQAMWSQYQSIAELAQAAAKVGHAVPVLLNADSAMASVQHLIVETRQVKDRWKARPFRVLSELGFRDAAMAAKESGVLLLSKKHCEPFLDLTPLIGSLTQVPDHTLFVLGAAGVGVVSPEFDLYESMCLSLSLASTSQREHLSLKAHLEQSDQLDSVFRKQRELAAHSRNAVIAAFLLVEAFMNGLARLTVSDGSRGLSENERLFLKERVRKQGQERQKFVSIEDKVVEWTKIISPSGRTFDKGREPFQSFSRLKQYRDAIVHFGPEKVEEYRAIDCSAAKACCGTAIQIIKEVCEFVEARGNTPSYPFWLRDDLPLENALARFPEQ
jgi:hypothetical protein